MAYQKTARENKEGFSGMESRTTEQRNRKGFVLTVESIFALSVLIIAAVIIFSYLQNASVDTFSGIRLSKYSMDFLSVHEKKGSFLGISNFHTSPPIILLPSLPCPANFTGYIIMNSSVEKYENRLAKDTLRSIPDRYCAELDFELQNSSEKFSTIPKPSCKLTGGDYAVTRRIIVLSNITTNTTYCQNSTNQNQKINRTVISTSVYSYGIATLTLWYTDSVRQ